MKWRNSVVYLAVLALLGGYYYYFEIVKKEQKIAEEQQAKRIFHFKANDVQAMSIESKDKKSVRLVKNGTWEIAAPIRCQADQATMEGLVNTIVTLEAERTVIANPSDLNPYGLGDPALRLKIEEKKQFVQLILGDKNPSGDGYYAKIGNKSNVFLLPQGMWGILHKGADELRRRELSTFDPEKVVGVAVIWKNGEQVLIERPESADTWKAESHPDIKIKTSKVENVLDQMRWLRAQKFVENDVKHLEKYGLATPQVTVNLQLANSNSIQVKLGETSEDGKELTALSSELPAVVTIDADILKDLPNNVAALQDRSLLALKANGVDEVRWHLGDKGGRFVRMGENTWGVSEKGEQPKELQDSWQISSLLYDLAEAEYMKKLNPSPAVPSDSYGRLDFYHQENELVSLAWNQDLQQSPKPQTVWIKQGEKPFEVVEVEPELIRRTEEDLNKLAVTETGKP